MSRVQQIKNLWGIQGGENPQRTDLWQVDMNEALAGVRETLSVQSFVSGQSFIGGSNGVWSLFPPSIPRHFIAAISLPELRVRADVVRRDSRPYNMPSWDDAVDPVKISFILDDGNSDKVGGEAPTPKVIQLLEGWRQLVRAGLGPMGSESSVVLDKNYRIDFQFPIYLYFCRGYSLPPSSATGRASRVDLGDYTFQATFDAPVEQRVTQSQVLASKGELFLQQMNGGLELSAIVRLENAWLGGFKEPDLSYDQTKVAMVEATFYVDNILQLRKKTA